MILDFLLKREIKVIPGKLKPVVLLVLDGWGIAPDSPGNAISQAKTPNYKNLLTNYPHGQLVASGESVGLPANEVGNTEVGHLNLAAGRTIPQDLKRIDRAIEDGSFFENNSFYHAVNHVKKNSSALHIMGLVSSGNVHSSLNHLFALIDFCKRTGTTNVFLHLFTDGRDAPPEEGLSIIEKIENYLKAGNPGKIATVSGRYFAMDRDKRWDRTAKAYNAIVRGIGLYAEKAEDAVKAAYVKDQTDEFIEPTVLGQMDPSTKKFQPVATVSDNDAVIFFNFRIDRPRQLTMSFVIGDFERANLSWEFDPYAVKYEAKEEGKAEVLKREPFPGRIVLKNLFFVTMTQYQKNLPVSEVAFPPFEIKDNLPVVLSHAGIKQMHMAESEKERFVTYYFDGLREQRLLGEDTLIVPSPHVATYDKKPEMSIWQLKDEFKKVLNRDEYRFILINIANPDMVAHTGNLKATIEAIDVVDKVLKEISDAVLTCDGTLIVTADHGNAEELITYSNTSFYFSSSEGTVNTDHSNYPVPIIIINKALVKANKFLGNGTLADIAPTILKLLNLQIPSVMTGKNLLVLNKQSQPL